MLESRMRKLPRLPSRFLQPLIPEARNNIQTIAAIIGVWYGKARLRTEIKVLTPLDRLSMLVSQTSVQANVNTESAAKRLWEVYGRVVELEFGDPMDELRERESIERMGRTCSRLDLNSHKDRSKAPHRDAMRRGLHDGTSDADRFDAAYQKQLASSS